MKKLEKRLNIKSSSLSSFFKFKRTSKFLDPAMHSRRHSHHYSVNIQDAIMTELDFTNNSWQPVPRTRGNPRSFFNGPAGTGKTHLARKIAKGLGLPLIKLNLEGGNYESFTKSTAPFGGKRRIFPFYPKSSSRRLPKGHAKQCGHFIDEVDKVLNQDNQQATDLQSFSISFLTQMKPPCDFRFRCRN